MILFALGIIVGLLLAVIWLLIAPKIPVEPQKLAETMQTSLKGKPRGAIIHAPTDDFYALQSKFKQADQDKEDLVLDDLLS